LQLCSRGQYHNTYLFAGNAQCDRPLETGTAHLILSNKRVEYSPYGLESDLRLCTLLALVSTKAKCIRKGMAVTYRQLFADILGHVHPAICRHAWWLR
jgi:hypothetical protein